jgi:hypothetical protein
MSKPSRKKSSQPIENEWITFPGGELEGRRPKTRCAECRVRPRATLCFQCYRADLERQKAIKAAGAINTASDERFQSLLPFEPVDTRRLTRLRTARATSRAALTVGAGRFVDKRRQAQIAARHALQRIAGGLHTREAERQRAVAAAIHAAELQLPDAWLPYVVA